MQSEINVSITIDHEENLPYDAATLAGEIAKFVRGIAEGDKPLPGITIESPPRHHVSGPVRVFLRSAFIVKNSEDM